MDDEAAAMTDKEKAQVWLAKSVSQHMGWEWRYTPTAVIPVEAGVAAILAVVRAKGERCSDMVCPTPGASPEWANALTTAERLLWATADDVPEPPR